MARTGKFIASIEARVGSSRLPGKVLREIMGRPMLELMIERVKQSTQVSEVVVATTVNPNDDAIAALASRMQVPCYRGSEEDVLLRVLETARSRKADHIVELWGDTPLLDPAIVDAAVAFYKNNNFDLVGTKGYPFGMSMLIFPTSVLEEVNVVATEQVHRENVSTYITWHPEKYPASQIPVPPHLQRPELRLVVDEMPDFQMVTKVFEHFGPNNLSFDTAAIIKFLDAHPEIRDMNKKVQQRIFKPEGAK